MYKVKTIAIYILLVFYIVVQLRPILPMAQDVVAHTFFKMQHMATIHYENGNYHLHSDLKTINDDENASNKTSQKSSSEKSEKNNNELLTQLNFNFYSNSSLIPTTITSVLDVSLGFTQLQYLPPKTA